MTFRIPTGPVPLALAKPLKAAAGRIAPTSGAAVVLHSYWRGKSVKAGSYRGGALGEMEMRATASGADITTGGTPISGSQHSGRYSAGKAFDGVLRTAWVGTTRARSWLGYHFAEPVDIQEMVITARNVAPNQMWEDFNIEYSDDGVVWTTAWSETGETGWTVSEVRVFTKP